MIDLNNIPAPKNVFTGDLVHSDLLGYVDTSVISKEDAYALRNEFKGKLAPYRHERNFANAISLLTQEVIEDVDAWVVGMNASADLALQS